MIKTISIGVFSRYRIAFICVIVSVLLSLWLIHLEGVVNRDGVLYLKSAEAFVDGNWREAFDIYRWPLFALLIAGVHELSGWSLETAAHAVNTVLYAVLVLAFIWIVQALGATRRTLWFAAIFILALPSLNAYRSFVLRDIGFWAFYLLALLAFFKFQVRPTFAGALSWGMAMAVATLFRIEGIVFLLLLPAVVLWRPRFALRRAVMQFIQLEAVALAGFMAATAWLSTAGAQAFSGRLLEPLVWMKLFGQQLTSGLANKADLLEQGVLNSFSDDFAMPSVLLILLLILITHVVKGLSVVGVFAATYAWFARAVPASTEARRAWLWLVVLNIVVLVVFITEQFFLTGRYVIALALTLGLLAPFGLNRAYECWRERQVLMRPGARWAFPVAALLICVMVVDSLWSFGAPKTHLKEAGLWLRTDTPAEARLYSESTVVGFYAHKSGDEWKRKERPAAELLKAGALQQYDYVAIVLKRDESVPASFSSAQPVREFSNERNERVMIFKAADLQPAS